MGQVIYFLSFIVLWYRGVVVSLCCKITNKYNNKHHKTTTQRNKTTTQQD